MHGKGDRGLPGSEVLWLQDCVVIPHNWGILKRISLFIKIIFLILKTFSTELAKYPTIEEWVHKSLNIHIMKYHADCNIYAGIKNYILNNTESFREMPPQITSMLSDKGKIQNAYKMNLIS